jgi:hypothetical protein
MRLPSVNILRKGSSRAQRDELVCRSLLKPKQRGVCEALRHMVAMAFMFCLFYWRVGSADCAGKILASMIRVFKYMQIGISSLPAKKTTSLDSYMPKNVVGKNPGNRRLPLGPVEISGSCQRDLRRIRWRESIQRALLIGSSQDVSAPWLAVICQARKRVHPFGQSGLVCRT